MRAVCSHSMTMSTRNQSLGFSDEEVEFLNDLAKRSCCSFEQALHQAISLGLESLEARAGEQKNLVANGCDAGLSPRQRQVLGLLKLGYSVKEIAGEMGVSETTVRTHVTRLKERTGCTDILRLRMPENANHHSI